MTERNEQAAAIELLRDRLTSGRLLPVRRALHALNPAEIADLLESLPPRHRKLVWDMVSADDDGEVLLHLNDKVRAELMRQMDVKELVAAASELEIDDLADFIEHLPETVTQQILKALGDADRARLEAVLAYEPDTAGGLMNTDTVTIRANVTLDVVLRYLRRRDALPSHTDALFVVDRYGHYLGALPLATLLTQDGDAAVATVMATHPEAIPASWPETRVAQRFEHADLVSAPVIDGHNRLVGRITVDDVVDVIRRESEQKLMSLAGLSEDEDIFAPARGDAPSCCPARREAPPSASRRSLRRSPRPPRATRAWPMVLVRRSRRQERARRAILPASALLRRDPLRRISRLEARSHPPPGGISIGTLPP